jgi:hypothetical protein
VIRCYSCYSFCYSQRVINTFLEAILFLWVTYVCDFPLPEWLLHVPIALWLWHISATRLGFEEVQWKNKYEIWSSEEYLNPKFLNHQEKHKIIGWNPRNSRYTIPTHYSETLRIHDPITSASYWIILNPITTQE